MDRSCTSNQVGDNCFTLNSACVKECENSADSGCYQAGMYGYVKQCPLPPLARPKVNEGYFTPDSPEKIARLSEGGFNASRDVGLLTLPGKMSINKSRGMMFIGGGILLLVIGFAIFMICKRAKKDCSTCSY